MRRGVQDHTLNAQADFRGRAVHNALALAAHAYAEVRQARLLEARPTPNSASHTRVLRADRDDSWGYRLSWYNSALLADLAVTPSLVPDNAPEVR